MDLNRQQRHHAIKQMLANNALEDSYPDRTVMGIIRDYEDMRIDSRTFTTRILDHLRGQGQRHAR